MSRRRLGDPVMLRAAAGLSVWAWVALVLAVAAGSLFHVLGNDFVWDDGPFIVWNESLHGPGTLQRIVTAGDAFGTGVRNPYYRPVTTLSFAIDRRLFGENPVGYHATNLLLHLVVCGLVFLVGLKHTGRPFAAGAAALLFAVHPATVEPVAYVSARADLLCAGFVLGAWLLHLRGRESGSPRHFGLAAVVFAFALFSKIVALALLPVLVLREVMLARGGERRFRPLLPLAAVAGVFLLARMLVLERTTWDAGVPFMSRLVTVGPLLIEYFRNTLLPFGLKVFYDQVLRTSWADPAVIRAWVIVAGCAGAWLLLAPRRPVIALGISWYCFALFPASGVVDLLYPALMADRYLYIPLAGVALAVAGAIPDPAAWRDPQAGAYRGAAAGAGLAALAACVLAFAVTSTRLVPAWHDPVALWEKARRGAPTSPYVLNALGWSYRQVDRLDDAEQVLMQAAVLAPDFTDAKVNLAAVAFLRGDVESAAKYTEQVLRINPRDAVALRYRGIVFEGQGRIELAIESLRAAVEADPFDTQTRRHLSELETGQGGEL